MRAAIKAYRCGFADYLTEEARVGQVIRDAVARAARSVHQRREESAHTELLELLAQRDSLTGLANRNSVEERLDQLMHIKARYGSPFAIILIRSTSMSKSAAASDTTSVITPSLLLPGGWPTSRGPPTRSLA